MAAVSNSAGKVTPAVVKQTAEAAASKSSSASVGVQRSIWRAVSHGNTAFIGFHATSRVCEYANSQWQKGGANVLVAAVAYTVGQVVAFVFDVVKTAFTLLTLPLPLLPGFHVILNAFQGTRSDLYGSYIDFTAMRNLNNAIVRGDDLTSLMAKLAEAEVAKTNELSLAQMDQGDHTRLREADQLVRAARKAIIDNVTNNSNLSAIGILNEIDAQAKHLEDLNNRPYPLKGYETMVVGSEKLETQERLTVSLTGRVLDKLKAEVYSAIVEKFAKEMRADLHQELSHAKIFNEQADELLGDVATIPGHSVESAKQDLQAQCQHYGKDFEAAHKKLEQVCANEKSWNEFVATRQKVTQSEVANLQKHFKEAPAELIAKLNAPMQCDIGAGTKNHANKVVKTIPGLGIAKDANFEAVQQAVQAKVQELDTIIESFESKNNKIGIWNVMQGWSSVEFTEAAIEEHFEGFVEYQKAVCQKWHLEKGTGFNAVEAQMVERAQQLKAKENDLNDIPKACREEIESRKRLIETYAPQKTNETTGEKFAWNNVNEYLGAKTEETAEDSSVPETAADDSSIPEPQAEAPHDGGSDDFDSLESSGT